MMGLKVVLCVLFLVQHALVLRVSADDEFDGPNPIAYEDEDTLDYQEEPMSGDDVVSDEADDGAEDDMDDAMRMKRQVNNQRRYPSSIGVVMQMKNYVQSTCGASALPMPSHSVGKPDLQMTLSQVQRLSSQIGRVVYAYSNSLPKGHNVAKEVDKFFLGSGKWSMHGSMVHLSCLFAKALPIFMQMYALQLPDFTHKKCDSFARVVAEAKYKKSTEGCLRPSIIWSGREAYKKDVKCLAKAFKQFQLVTASATHLLNNSTSGRFSYRQIARLLTNNVVTFSDLSFDARNMFDASMAMKSLYVSNSGSGKSVICNGYRLAHETVNKRKPYA